eukprot:3652154-Rhodomonas_salina.2
MSANKSARTTQLLFPDAATSNGKEFQCNSKYGARGWCRYVAEMSQSSQSGMQQRVGAEEFQRESACSDQKTNLCNGHLQEQEEGNFWEEGEY